MLKALEEPVRQIASNAGIDGSVIIKEIKDRGEANIGFDAYAEKFTDMIDAGIIDPAKVVRIALENAASIASMVLTTESLVADISEETPPSSSMNPGMGGMY